MEAPDTAPEAPEAPDEGESPDSGEQDDGAAETDDGETEDDEAHEEGEGDTPADDGAEEQHILSEQALEKRARQLEAENERHAKRVGQIMDDAAADLIPCPVCMDGIAGWIYPPEVAQLSDEAISRVRTVIGLPDYTTFLQAKFAAKCPDCDGRGEVKTGSQVPGSEVTTCETCQKRGWIRTQDIPRIATAEPPAGDQTTGPTVYAADEADVEVRNLRQRGFTVIPPTNFASTG